eukprot:gnl/TRDRNA2_/TRDRNA2_153146_c0_seq2.p1 gnl/TRDRNA2_/TRDRNA2_153146_c0~~gnl/TRDRNA2_/TRDRNA2_153146_c0_seq2.p1  ORF type:complete len:398 (-),score=72.09 gnl/TRDRNA2_/TRDRNA2_153146_c0_seq2:48-1241(-)
MLKLCPAHVIIYAAFLAADAMTPLMRKEKTIDPTMLTGAKQETVSRVNTDDVPAIVVGYFAESDPTKSASKRLVTEDGDVSEDGVLQTNKDARTLALDESRHPSRGTSTKTAPVAVSPDMQQKGDSLTKTVEAHKVQRIAEYIKSLLLNSTRTILPSMLTTEAVLNYAHRQQSKTLLNVFSQIPNSDTKYTQALADQIDHQFQALDRNMAYLSDPLKVLNGHMDVIGSNMRLLNSSMSMMQVSQHQPESDAPAEDLVLDEKVALGTVRKGVDEYTAMILKVMQGIQIETAQYGQMQEALTKELGDTLSKGRYQNFDVLSQILNTRTAGLNNHIGEMIDPLRVLQAKMNSVNEEAEEVYNRSAWSRKSQNSSWMTSADKAQGYQDSSPIDVVPLDHPV